MYKQFIYIQICAFYEPSSKCSSEDMSTHHLICSKFGAVGHNLKKLNHHNLRISDKNLKSLVTNYLSLRVPSS